MVAERDNMIVIIYYQAAAHNATASVPMSQSRTASTQSARVSVFKGNAINKKKVGNSLKICLRKCSKVYSIMGNIVATGLAHYMWKKCLFSATNCLFTST